MLRKLWTLNTILSLSLIHLNLNTSIACEGEISCEDSDCPIKTSNSTPLNLESPTPASPETIPASKKAKTITSPSLGFIQTDSFTESPTDIQETIFSFLKETDLMRTQVFSSGFRKLTCELFDVKHSRVLTALPTKNNRDKNSLEDFKEATHPLIAIDLISRLLEFRSTLNAFPASLDLQSLNPVQLQLTRQRIENLHLSLRDGTLAKTFIGQLLNYLNSASIAVGPITDSFSRYEIHALKKHGPSQELLSFCYQYGIGTRQDLDKAREYSQAETNYFKDPTQTYVNSSFQKLRYHELLKKIETSPATRVQELTNQEPNSSTQVTEPRTFELWQEILANPYSNFLDKVRAARMFMFAQDFSHAAVLYEAVLQDPEHTLHYTWTRPSSFQHQEHTNNLTPLAKMFHKVTQKVFALNDKRSAAKCHYYIENFVRANEISNTILLNPDQNIEDQVFADQITQKIKEKLLLEEASKTKN